MENSLEKHKITENKKEISELYRNCIEMLFAWGKLEPKQKIKRWIRKSLLHQAVAPVDPWFWPQAMLADGIMAVIVSGECTPADREAGLSSLERYYDMWIHSGQKLYYVDNAMHGMTLLDLYEQTGKEKYRKAADKLADYLGNYPLDTAGNLCYRIKDRNLIFADVLGMVCPFLCRYGQLTGRQELTELGISQLTNFLKRGMDENSGLPYHGYDSGSGVKQGCIGWGRAVGWLMMGLCGSLNCLPKDHQKYEVLLETAENLERIIWYFQRPDGGFSWLLPAVEGPADTSATAMIVSALVEKGLSGKSGETQRIQKAQEFLRKHLNNGNVDCASGECEGFGQYPQKFGVYPWGNGTVLKLMKMTDYSENEVN